MLDLFTLVGETMPDAFESVLSQLDQWRHLPKVDKRYRSFPYP